jgi:tetratricopeptide (TPR) repeat protein
VAGEDTSRRRRWVFRLAAALGAPLLVLGAVELGLRIAGFGYPTSFTIACEVGGVPSRCDNPDFSRTYFPAALARPPIPFSFPRDKSEGAVRIFVVGASAAQGDPDPTFGPARMLELLLADRYPGTRFEVINAAVTAINSHVVLSIVRELVDYQPDLLIVYLGNNEVVGPYGAGTVFSPISRSWPLIRASILARRTRTGQLIARLSRRSGGAADSWRGMEMFVGHEVRQDDPRMDSVYAHFARNLEGIIAAARGSGVPVVLSTVATNLADCAPFGSVESEGLREAERTRRDAAVGEGETYLAAGERDAALVAFLEAVSIDPDNAELRFRAGRLSGRLGDARRAGTELTAARDLDTLRFRADSRINQEIVAMAETRTDGGVVLADVASRFGTRSPNGVPGRTLFYEHVHPTFAGNYLIARSWLETLPQVVQRLVPADPAPHVEAEELARRLAFTGFDRRRVWSTVAARLARPPFTGQLDHAEQLRYVEAEIARHTPPDWIEVFGTYERAVAARPEDPWLRFNLSEALAAAGRPAAAAAELERFLETYPRDPSARERLCRARVAEGRYEDALAECGRVTVRLPHHTPPYYAMAYALANLGRYDDAIGLYRELLEREPDEASQILNEIGRIEMHRGRPDAAATVYREAIETADRQTDEPIPDLRFNHASALRAAGREDEARREFERAIAGYRRVVEQSPEVVAPRVALARALAALGRREDAITVLRHALTLDPDHPEARAALARLTDGDRR